MDHTEQCEMGLWKKSTTEHQAHRVRRHNLPSTSRIAKYCLLTVFLLLTVAIYKKQAAISAYSTLPSDNPHTHADSTPQRTAPTLSTLPNNSSTFYPKFGKCTASFGDSDPPYEAAIVSHNLHNQIHGYPHYILREHMIRGLWSKHGWIMTVLGQELSKPEEQRLKWLLWHDRDTVLMNPQIPLDIFVPPEREFGHVNLLVTKDRNGLNNGVFMVRVGQWAMKLFASALSIREYQPNVMLKYTEQSGMEETIKRPWWNSSVAYVPQRWFNGFPPNVDVEHDSAASHSRPGSLLIHFASNRDGLRPQRMAHWGEVARTRAPEWDKSVEETYYLEEIAEYWARVGRNESFDSINRDIGRRAWILPKDVKQAKEKMAPVEQKTLKFQYSGPGSVNW